MEEYLRPYEGMARHAGMTWHKPLIAYGNPTDADLAAKQLAAAAAEYQKRLEELVK
ncbi:MAG: NAD(P)H-dependent oxidoreductase, partial [Muribaculaceae bacterium]|nr:NAD(P)H-dependent oxidoreductase [Muribaculaceae bacterium]